MCDEAGCVMVTAFCRFWLLLYSNHVTSVKLLGQCPVSCILLISCVSILRPSSPNNLSISPGTSSSLVTFLSLTSLTVFFPFHCAYLIWIYIVFKLTSRFSDCLVGP
jgi:cytochrome bd-type quinol oxidase subunit 2